MTLKEYLENNGINKTWFANKTGISRRTIHNICSGKKVSPLIAKTVEVFTHGNVKAESICSFPDNLPLLTKTIDVLVAQGV